MIAHVILISSVNETPCKMSIIFALELSRIEIELFRTMLLILFIFWSSPLKSNKSTDFASGTFFSDSEFITVIDSSMSLLFLLSIV